MRRGLWPRFLALLLALLLIPACAAGPPVGPLTKPEVYPNRTEPGTALWSFLWAWRSGDVDVLQTITGAWLAHDLALQIEKNGRGAVSEWYARGMESMRIDDLEWTKEGESLAYVRVVFSTETVERTERDYSLLRRPGGWVVSGQRLLR